MYTGVETRVMMNLRDSSLKVSALERKLNYYVVFVVSFTYSLCILAAIMTVHVEYKSAQMVDSYIPPTGHSDGKEGLFSFFRYFILLNTMLPISMFVALEFIKAWQAVFLSWDAQMYCAEQNKFARPLTSSLIEELGQIDYLFSDKTGTLTMNVMSMKDIAVCTQTYETVEGPDGS